MSQNESKLAAVAISITALACIGSNIVNIVQVDQIEKLEHRIEELESK